MKKKHKALLVIVPAVIILVLLVVVAGPRFLNARKQTRRNVGCDDRGPTSKSIHVPPESTWSALRNHLIQGARENCVVIKINGAPFYMACYSPYGDTRGRPARKEEPPHVITANEPFEVVESWVARFHLKGAFVQIDADVPVSRVTRLAEMFDRHRITAYWCSEANPGSSITIWQTSLGYVPGPATTNDESPAAVQTNPSSQNLKRIGDGKGKTRE